LNVLSAFWDSSMLVPLCAKQSSTALALAFYKRYRPVVWWGTPVEVASALARLLRMQLLSPAEWARSRVLADDLADQWSVVQPTEEIRHRAIDLVNRFDLRSADSLQLSAALEWCAGAPKGRTFLTLDGRLRDAALLCGFGVPKA
jgi:predicted nucleic acid-binding protein